MGTQRVTVFSLCTCRYLNESWPLRCMPLLLCLFLFLSPSFCYPQSAPLPRDTVLTISEVMFYAPSGNNEYIEIHNLSSTATIDLAGYAVQYETNSFDYIRTTGKGTKLLPRAYAIILEGDYDSLNGIYNAAIPAAALILKINNNAFGSNGMANTAERIVSLIRPDSSVIEGYTYTPQNNAAGISDEKIVLNKNNAAVNWANSKTVNGSPGIRNTVTPPDFDLVLRSLIASPEFCKPGTQILLSSCIKNNGAIQTGSYILKLYHDRNRDNVPGANELIFQLGSFPLSFGDSTILDFNYTLTDTGKQYFIAFVETPSDDIPANNYAYTTVLCTYGTPPASGLRINEIMYAPANVEPEWIELINFSAVSVDLFKMTIHDKFSLSSINTHRVLQPKEYIVITKDSSVKNFYSESFPFLTASLPVFNNDSDAVVLRDSTGRTLDSLIYHAHWGGNNGFSLERVLPDTLSSDSTNWKSCAIVTRATPGHKNSVAIKNYDVSVSSITGLPAYVAVGTGFTVNGIIKNNGTLSSGNILVRLLFDANNDGIPQPNETVVLQDIPSLAPYEETTHSFSILPETTGRLRYFFHASVSLDENTYNDYIAFIVPVVEITVQRNDIIINEIMPRPESGRAEWIELYNNSESPVPLNKFQIADANDSVSLSVTDAVLLPGKYIVIGRDNSFSQQYPSVPALIVQFPAQNDNGDKLMILDSLGRIIDSLAYPASWLGAQGYSLERIEPSSSSTDSANWKVCVTPAKSSVGDKNSVTRKEYDIAILGVTQFPKYLEQGNISSFSAIISNTGKQTCSNIGVKLFHDANTDGIAQSTELISNETLPQLNSGANASIPFFIQPSGAGTYRYILQVVTPLDEAAYNDFYFCSLVVINAAMPRGSIVINEFMCKPETGESEWIELFNRTDSIIYLRGVQCADTHDTVDISNTQIPINAHNYLVLTKDSVLIKQFPDINAIICSFPILNDDGDGIMIMDSLNRIIDSLEYTNSWSIKKGISFERISSSGSSTDTLNWHHSLSPDKATPGKVNYVTPQKQDAAISGIYVSPPFAYVGDSIEIYCLIKNLGTAPTVDCSLTFFDVTLNKQLFQKNITTTILPGDSLSISTGYFVLSDSLLNIKVQLTTAAEDDSSNNTKYITYRANEKPGSVIISEVMYAPENGGIEWVELYNNSGAVIDLYDWSISDVQPAPKSGSFTSHVFIDSASYLTVTNAPEAGSAVQTRASFGVLNNAGDGVILYNRGGQVIDSIVYDNSWFGKDGKSLERLRASGSSTDKYNWHYSLSSYGSTPASKNSSEQLKSNSNPQLLISEILYEPAANNAEFIELFNAEQSDLQIGGCKVRLANGSILPLSDTLFLVPPQTYFVLLQDTIGYTLFPHLATYRYKSIAAGSGFSLNNSGGTVVMLNAFDYITDSIQYHPGMHTIEKKEAIGHSLERISFSSPANEVGNWGSSPAVQGATPGLQNAITEKLGNIPPGVSISPNPFSPDNDGFEDEIEIRYGTTYNQVSINIRIFDDKGRPRKTLLKNHYANGSGVIRYDGRDDGGNALPLGMYIVLMDITDTASGHKKVYKQVLVSARKL